MGEREEQCKGPEAEILLGMFEQQGGNCAWSKVNGGENRSELLESREAGGGKKRLGGVFEEEAQRGLRGGRLCPLLMRGTDVRRGSGRGLHFL